jgi:hypothetical protein
VLATEQPALFGPNCKASLRGFWYFFDSSQIARYLTDLNDGFLRGKRDLILDQDTKYSGARVTGRMGLPSN